MANLCFISWSSSNWICEHGNNKQARKPRSYASPKLCPLNDLLNDLLTGVKCRATSVAKKDDEGQDQDVGDQEQDQDKITLTGSVLQHRLLLLSQPERSFVISEYIWTRNTFRKWIQFVNFKNVQMWSIKCQESWAIGQLWGTAQSLNTMDPLSAIWSLTTFATTTKQSFFLTFCNQVSFWLSATKFLSETKLKILKSEV